MAMDLRLTGEEAAALHAEAESQNRSIRDVAGDAIREYVARRYADAEVHRLGVESVERWQNLLDRLSQ